MSISTNDTLLQSDDKRAWRSWALYDWANSAFATTVMAGFSHYFSKHIGRILTVQVKALIFLGCLIQLVL